MTLDTVDTVLYLLSLSFITCSYGVLCPVVDLCVGGSGESCWLVGWLAGLDCQIVTDSLRCWSIDCMRRSAYSANPHTRSRMGVLGRYCSLFVRLRSFHRNSLCPVRRRVRPVGMKTKYLFMTALSCESDHRTFCLILMEQPQYEYASCSIIYINQS